MCVISLFRGLLCSWKPADSCRGKQEKRFSGTAGLSTNQFRTGRNFEAMIRNGEIPELRKQTQLTKCSAQAEKIKAEAVFKMTLFYDTFCRVNILNDS